MATKNHHIGPNTAMTMTPSVDITATTTSSSSSSRIEQSTVWLSIVVFIINSIFLIYFHCQTTNSSRHNNNNNSTSIVVSWLFSNPSTMKMMESSIPNTTTNLIHIPQSVDSYINNPNNSTPWNSSDTMSVPIDHHHYYDYSPNIDMILFTSIIIMAFELLDYITRNSGKWLRMNSIPVRGKHLDELRRIDYYCIAFSKANTAPFTYFYLRYCYEMDPSIVQWSVHASSLTIYNTIVPLVVLFLLFDIFYSIFHCILHLQFLYPYIHKHHHIQKAPSRANVDAVNVHPIEFIGGEYNHLFVLYLYTTVFRGPIHIVTAILFLVLGGILAGINHTRYDLTIAIPVPNILKLVSTRQQQSTTRYILYWTLYDSKAHDVHHRIPQSNYGQYFMLWDYLMGSYRPYNPNDRINPDAQLDPKTGKSWSSDSTKVKSQ